MAGRAMSWRRACVKACSRSTAHWLALAPLRPQNRASPVAERTRLKNTAASLPPGHPPDPAESIALTLAEQGWCISDAFTPPLLTSQLRHEAETHWHRGAFRRAGVGRGNDRELRDEVRTDRVAWLDPVHLSAAQQLYWDRLEAVRLAANRTLFLGLYEFEAHLAVYPAGTYYRKHLDQFRGIAGRRLSCVLYLNRDWSEADGGALRLYIDSEQPDAYLEVLPLGGRLVTFLSARFLHEVLPARRERFSVAGWFRSRG